MAHEKLFAAMEESGLFSLTLKSEAKRKTDKKAISTLIRTLQKREDPTEKNDQTISKILERRPDYEDALKLLLFPKSKKVQEAILKYLLDNAEQDSSKIFFVLTNSLHDTNIKKEAINSFEREVRKKREKTLDDWRLVYIYSVPESLEENLILKGICELTPQECISIAKGVTIKNEWKYLHFNSFKLLIVLEKILKICLRKELEEGVFKQIVAEKTKKLSSDAKRELAEQASENLKKYL